MKKKIALILALMVCAMLSGCGDSDVFAANGTQENINDTQAVTNELTSAQGTPTDINYSLERYNLIRRAYWVKNLSSNGLEPGDRNEPPRLHQRSHGIGFGFCSCTRRMWHYRRSRAAEML